MLPRLISAAHRSAIPCVAVVFSLVVLLPGLPSTPMGVLVRPRMANSVIDRGDVVIISVDPVASVASLRDEQATAAASEIPYRKYLVIAHMWGDVNWSLPPWEAPLTMNFFAVGRGLPNPPYASIPLGPGLPHPLSRKPLDLPVALPWPDCYIHTLEPIGTRIQRVYMTSPTALRLTNEQVFTINFFTSADQSEAPLFRDANGQPLELGSDSNPDEPYEYDLPSEFFQSGSEFDEPNRDGDAEQQQSADETSQPALPTRKETILAELQAPSNSDVPEIEADEEGCVKIKVDVWLDLSSTPEIGSPAELSDSIGRLFQIEREWAERKALAKLADQPRTSKWAADVAAASGAGSVALDDIARNPGLPDDAITPEDAIERRNEKVSVNHDSLSREPDRGKFVLAGRRIAASFRSALRTMLCLGRAA